MGGMGRSSTLQTRELRPDEWFPFKLTSSASMGDLVPHPSIFKSIPLFLSNHVMASRAQDVIQQRADGNEPPVHFAQSFHDHPKASVNSPLIEKPSGQMRIDDTSPTFSRQSVLVYFTRRRIEGVNVRTF